MIKNGLNKSIIDKVLIVFIALFLVSTITSSILLAIVYREPPYTQYTSTVKYCDLKVAIKNKAVVKPALIYDYVENISSNKVYLSLLKYIVLDLYYDPILYSNTKYGSIRDVSIDYTIYLIISSGVWSKTILFKEPSHIDAGKFRDTILLNMSKIHKIVNTIEKETGIKTRSYTITLSIDLLTNVVYGTGVNATYRINPKVSISIDKEGNMVTITKSGDSKSYTDEKTIMKKKMFNLLGLDILASRTLLTYTTIALALTLFTLTTIYITKFKEKKVYEQYITVNRPYILPGRVVDLGNKPLIEVNDFRKFLSLARRYNKVIVLADKADFKELYIILDNAIYVYRLYEK